MEQVSVIGAPQIRAARALLDWSQDDLAQATRLSIATIRKLELGYISPRQATTSVLRQKLEEAGIEFIAPDGVCRRPEGIAVYQGAEGIDSFFEDFHQTIKSQPGESVIVTGAESVLFSSEDMDGCCRRLQSVLEKNEGATVKCLLMDFLGRPQSSRQLEFRTMSKNYVDPMPFYAYGDKHAIVVPGAGSSPRIIAVRSVMAAQAARRQFYSMWEMATPCVAQQAAVYAVRRSCAMARRA
jgi:transcriptional regulator with XRE-family HTH domain